MESSSDNAKTDSRFENRNRFECSHKVGMMVFSGDRKLLVDYTANFEGCILLLLCSISRRSRVGRGLRRSNAGR